MKYKKLFLLIFGIFLLSFLRVSNVRAACVDDDSSSDRYTLSGSCQFDGTLLDGIDANGANSTNSAILTVRTGATLTIPAQQTFATGIIDLKGGGTIVIIKNGKIKLKTPIYMTDKDDDGYPASTSAIIIPNLTPGMDKRKYALTNPTTIDANDNQRCANADTISTALSALYNTTCNKCSSGALATQANNEDLYSQCTLAYNGCSGAAGTNGICVKTATVGDLCNGTTAACVTGSANVADQKVCSGGSEVVATTSLYASISNSCNTASCGGTKYYRACNGSGATRTDNTGAASQPVYASAGQSLDTSCNTGANGNPGATCQKCNGSGSVITQANNEDLYSQCTLAYNGCSGAAGTNGICVKTATVGDLCNGTTAACVTGSANVADQKVCSGGSEVVATTSLYASTADVCTAGACSSTRYYRACNDAGATRTDNTAAASGPGPNASSGNTFTAACASSTASTCAAQTTCKNLTYCNGSGACNTPTDVTSYNEGLNCTAACTGCNGSGSCVNIPNATTDSWGSNVCTATHYTCNGSAFCTAPTTTSCSLRNTGISCTTKCSNIGAISCVSSHLNADSSCTGGTTSCGSINDLVRYCKCSVYVY